MYTNFENGGYAYGLEEDIVNYIALAEDPFGRLYWYYDIIMLKGQNSWG